MNAFLASTRGWFQYGTPRGALGPTQPLTFFLYWIPYSFYALAQSVGFQDVFLPAHDAGMLEAVFVKLFPMIGDVFLFVLLLRFSPGGKMFVWASFYFLNPLAILTSSVRGHYDTATMALIVAGVFFMKNQKIARGSVSFLAAGMVQLLGFIPFTLSLLQLFWTRRYKLGLGLASAAASVVLSYPPQRDLMYRLVLAISGLTASQQFTPLGRFTLLGSIPSLIFISSFHPLLVVGGLVLFRVSLTTFRGRLHVDSLLLYTILSYVAFLLLLDLPNRWYWVLPLGIVYAILKGKDSLAAYMLVFGTAASFFIVSNATGSAYYLVGQVGDPALMQPLIEGIRNGLTVFVVMVTTLTGLFLAYLCRRSDGDAGGTLARSSLIVFGVYLMAYFWVSVYPI